MSQEQVIYRRESDVGLITVDDGKANAMSRQRIAEVVAALDRAQQTGELILADDVHRPQRRDQVQRLQPLHIQKRVQRIRQHDIKPALPHLFRKKPGAGLGLVPVPAAPHNHCRFHRTSSC